MVIIDMAVLYTVTTNQINLIYQVSAAYFNLKISRIMVESA